MNRGQAFLLVALVLAALLSFVILLPFLEYVIAAVIFAYVLHPLHVRLEERIGSQGSALVLMAGALVLVVMPVVYVIRVFVRDLQAIAAGDVGLDIATVEEQIEAFTGLEVELEAVDFLTEVGELIAATLFNDVTGILAMVLEFTIGLALLLFLVFYLLRDGRSFVAWLRETIPLPERVTDRLFTRIHRITWGAVIGHAFAALVQAVVAGFGLYLAGIPNVVFWTFVMFLLAFLPIIGAFLVWAPAAVYLILIGETASGVLLGIYGLTVVSMIDYYARPLVIDRQARLNPGIILIGVFGGVYTLGFVGLFVGPIAIGVLAAILETFRLEYDAL